MIVKNESDVIRRCLESVLPIIDSWVIIDTGSTDNTKEIILDVLKGIPGKLESKEWVDFSHNRNEAIALAQEMADYMLFIDADEVISFPENYDFSSLTNAIYCSTVHLDTIRYARISLASTEYDWKYEGVLHEFLSCGVDHKLIPLDGFITHCSTDGARSKNPNKYREDAEVLKAALIKEPTNDRYAFYLAQSYRDAGMHDDAIEAYKVRGKMNVWKEEEWFCSYQIARLSHITGKPYAEVISAYFTAHQKRPSRIESMFWLGAYFINLEQYSNAVVVLESIQSSEYSKDILFIEHDIYNWLRIDSLALAYSYSGKTTEAKELWKSLSLNPNLPSAELARIRNNITYCG